MAAIYLGISLFFGGDPFRNANEKFYAALTNGADKLRDDLNLPFSGTLITCRDYFCPFVDTLAGLSDDLGIIHQHIETEKREREKTGEELAESIKRMKELYEPEKLPHENEEANSQRNE